MNEDAKIIPAGILSVADATWKQTYAPFVSREQIDYMYERMYDPRTLQEQMENGVHFLVYVQDDKTLAYSALEFREYLEGPEPLRVSYVHKLYIRPEYQRRQIGRKLLDAITAISMENGCQFLELNVNRSNPALQFYLKLGFFIHKTGDYPYGPYLLNDHILRKAII